MSNYTYIHGTIILSLMGRTQAEKRYILETVLQHLPVINDLNTYIIQTSGYDISSNVNEFGERTNNLAYPCMTRLIKSRKGLYTTQSKYILVVDGESEDNINLKDFIKWLTRLSKRIRINDIQIKFNNCNEDGEVLINNKNNEWTSMYISPSWLDEKTENWCEYLLWDYPKDKDGYILKGKPESKKN